MEKIYPLSHLQEIKNLAIVAVNDKNEPVMYCDPDGTEIKILENGAVIGLPSSGGSEEGEE